MQLGEYEIGLNYVYKCYNLFIYFSHPKYRMALNKKFPSLVCGKLDDDKSDLKSVSSAQTTISEDKV